MLFSLFFFLSLLSVDCLFSSVWLPLFLLMLFRCPFLLCRFVSSSKFIVLNVVFCFANSLLAFSRSLTMLYLFSLSEFVFCFYWICSLFIIFISSLRLSVSLTFSMIFSFLCCSCALMLIIPFFNSLISFDIFSFVSCLLFQTILHVFRLTFFIWCYINFDYDEIPKCFSNFLWYFLSLF